MRKQKIYTMIGLLTLLLLGACSLHEEENFFNEALKSYKEILVAPENGWLMQYYPGNNQAFGGYNLLVSFDENGSATIADELTDADKSVTSLYTLKQSAGPALTFDSYNASAQ